MKKFFGSLGYSKFLLRFSVILTSIAVIFLFCTQFESRTSGEAYTGSSFYEAFNEGWTVIRESGDFNKTNLPSTVEVKPDEILILENTIPDYVQDRMCLFMRSSRQNIRFFVDGNIRSEYIADNLPFFARNVPSAYVFMELSSFDAGRNIRIEMWSSSDFKGNLSEVSIAHASSAWNHIWLKYGTIVISNLILLISGIIAAIICLVFSFSLKKQIKLLTLSYAVILFSLWSICESRLRQIVFPNASYIGVLVFILMGLMLIPLFSFCNKIQRYRYAAWYNLINTCVFIYLILPTILYLLKICDLFDFILLNYVLIFAGMILVIITVIQDVIKGKIKEYRYCAFGIFIVILCGVLELILSRVQPFFAAGFFVSISLILLLLLCSAQEIQNLLNEYRDREQHMEDMTLRTIKTFAGTIDAKDEYTGGHSSRVAEYASSLARALGKSDRECRNIHYIGLMHDIGKIGIPDVILNKNGKLCPDEFSLMRLHTTIGCEIIGDIDSVEGLKEGVLYHHERYDGRGYPEGLTGENIPEVARILCIADSYDAMTSNRIYRKHLNDEEVRNEFAQNAGLQFDPYMSEVFIKLLDSGEVKPVTIDGFEITPYEDQSVSLALKKMISSQNGYVGAYEMTNPEFMRMIVYVLKLAERNHQTVIVKLFSVDAKDGTKLQGEAAREASDFLRSAINLRIRNTDITTPYSFFKRLVLFMNMNPENSSQVISQILEKFREIDVMEHYKLSVEDIVLN